MNGTDVLLLLGLLGLSAFFSASETAFSSASVIRLRTLAEEGSHKAKSALHLIENFDKTIATILVGNNVVNIAAASVATVLFTALFGSSGVGIATGVMTLLVITFGEIFPKSYAKEHAEGFALTISGLLGFISTVLTPVTWVFLGLRSALSRPDDDDEKLPSMTEQELKFIIEAIEEEGVLDQQESEMVQSALELGDKTVQEILTPRVDIVALDLNAPPEEQLQILLNERFSRVPVYEEGIDKICGIVQARDVLEAAVLHGRPDLRRLMKSCLFIHKTMRLSKLLPEFQRSKNHIAIVTDDYGGTLGLVTLEDVLEELVGEIWDETDEVEVDLNRVDEHVYEVSGDMSIGDFFSEIDYNPRDFESDYNTLGGWALECLQHIPTEGESFVHGRLHVAVAQMDEQRIEKLIITLQEEQQ